MPGMKCGSVGQHTEQAPNEDDIQVLHEQCFNMQRCPPSSQNILLELRGHGIKASDLSSFVDVLPRCKG